jgi:hypothetical protein
MIASFKRQVVRHFRFPPRQRHQLRQLRPHLHHLILVVLYFLPQSTLLSQVPECCLEQSAATRGPFLVLISHHRS